MGSVIYDDEEIISNQFDEYEEDVCYECTAYGDDYYEDDDGELVCRCFECPNFAQDIDDWD